MNNTRLRKSVCVVGGGPAGVVVSYLLAQIGVEVLLLEAHRDFDRDFRGDTIHSGIMELLDEMGLADDLLKLPHAKMRSLGMNVNGKNQQLIDFGVLKSRFPYVTMMPQCEFPGFMAQRAKSFEVRMGARAKKLHQTDKGYSVQFQEGTTEFIVDADLVIAADGRHSKIRKLLDLETRKTAVPMDVLWFRLPREQCVDVTPGGYVGDGNLLIVLERQDSWQIGFVFLHGKFREIKDQGIDWLKQRTAATLPGLEPALNGIQHWNDVAVLNVESSRVAKWYTKNVLLIGDAAHVMFPVGGVGINYAIQDAVVAAGILGPPLLTNALTEKHLASVQRERIWPTRLIQFIQGVMQK